MVSAKIQQNYTYVNHIFAIGNLCVIYLNMKHSYTVKLKMLLLFCSFLFSEITKAFQMFGISPTEDMDMVTQIKPEVRKLCTKNRICNEISVNEKEADKQANLKRMIAHPPPSQVTLLC